jgi:serine protease AprX
MFHFLVRNVIIIFLFPFICRGDHKSKKQIKVQMMKFLLMLLSCTVILFAQTPYDKIEPALKLKLIEAEDNEEILVWVIFTDKGANLNKYFLNPLEVVSSKSLQRREKVFPENQLIQFEDLPLNSNYIKELEKINFKVKQKSKWLNGVSGYYPKSSLHEIEKLLFVKKIDLVVKLQKPEPVADNQSTFSKMEQPEGIYSYNYGNSYTQVQQINVPAVHNLGFTGSNVTIGVMDAGFNRLSHEAFATMNIIATWDFVNNKQDVGDGGMGSGAHGTQTLSTIGGFKEGSLIGPAFGAAYILAKTENTDSETPIEEDNWIASIEWADSIGVDVTSTSLGYLTFDPPYPSYTWQSMDGNTCKITIAADLAVKRGIVVLNSAGNSGFHSTRNTLGAPADGDSVIAVGAVTSSGARSSFSSVGNTVDGRTKPDIMAMGSSVRVASPSSNTGYTLSSGTSFSCPLSAGVAALILDVNPNLTPMQVRDALRNTASNSSSPNREFGWGIVDALAAIEYFPVPVELISFTAGVLDQTIQLTWKTATEINNKGFEIEKKYNGEFSVIGYKTGSGTTAEEVEYSFIDNTPSNGKNIYRLKQIDFNGEFKYSSEVSVDFGNLNFHLSQNYPNPFNPVTTIYFTIPEAQNISLNIYNILGVEVAKPFNEYAAEGSHSVKVDMSGFPSGVYFYKISSEQNGMNISYGEAKKMILLK